MATRLVERTFTTTADSAAAWSHLAAVTSWPSWARHIRKVTLDPQGELTASTRGVFVLKPGVPTTFRMTALDEGRSWSWRGRFAGTTLDYDHVIEPLATGVRITFTIDGSGSTVRVVGPLFARVYGSMLDRAIPNLVAELDALG